MLVLVLVLVVVVLLLLLVVLLVVLLLLLVLALVLALALALLVLLAGAGAAGAATLQAADAPLQSMGGNGAWLLAAAHPQRFAAVVPVCGYVEPGRGEAAEATAAVAAALAGKPVFEHIYIRIRAAVRSFSNPYVHPEATY